MFRDIVIWTTIILANLMSLYLLIDIMVTQRMKHNREQAKVEGGSDE
jgi:hypothetical protein